MSHDLGFISVCFVVSCVGFFRYKLAITAVVYVGSVARCCGGMILAFYGLELRYYLPTGFKIIRARKSKSLTFYKQMTTIRRLDNVS